jgi:hypothetical protein
LSALRFQFSEKATKLLVLAVSLVPLLVVLACAGARQADQEAAPVPLALIRVQDGRPGGGPGQVTAIAFQDALETALGRGGFEVRGVREPSEAYPGLALKCVLDELPKVFSTPKRGRVSFLATVMVDGREVFSRTYDSEVFAHENQDVGDQAQKRALAFAFADLIRDLKTAGRNASAAPPSSPSKP